VTAHQSGWQSLPAALSAGVVLFSRGALRVVRNWAGTFDITRRALSYMFRRGLDRLAEEKSKLTFAPLPDAQFDALSPEMPSRETVAGEADEEVEAVIERIQRRGGGVFAVVGERGGGKTTVLERVRKALSDTVMVDCPIAGLDGLQQALAAQLNADPKSDLEQCAGLLERSGRDPALLIDNAHRLIQPVMGGLAAFDRLVDVARRHSTECTWFFAVDEVVWRFFERARGSRPLFDEVITLTDWREEWIARLLIARSQQAGIEPSFQHLLEDLPLDADDIDRRESLGRTTAGFYRLLWDYSAGNPGVALHMWRRG
jgi:hypothetical protein